MLLILALFVMKMGEQEERLVDISENDLVVIGQLSGVSARISHIHVKVNQVLKIAKNGADNETIYALWRPLVEHLSGIEELLVNGLLLSHEIENGQDLYVAVTEDFKDYKLTIINAIEMSSVDAAMAEKHLLEASGIFNHLVVTLQESLKAVSVDVNGELDENFESMTEVVNLIIIVFAVTAVGTFFISIFLSRKLTYDIGALIGVIDRLSSGKKDVNIPVVSSGKELDALAGGLQIFKRSLEKVDEQHLALEENNQKLRVEIDKHEKTEDDLVKTRAHFQYTLDHNPTIIYTGISSGSVLDVTFVSENSKKIIGYESGCLLGDKRKWLARLAIEDDRFLNAQMSELYRNGSMVCDYRIKNSDGDYVWIQDSLALSERKKGQIEVLGSLTDITEVKVAEENLVKLNGELFDLATSLEIKVKERTSELEEANRDLKQLSDAKSEFVSIVSHDLRTPLTGIKLFSEIMLDDLENIDRQSQEEYLSIISSETDRLGRLISNVLDFQKISAGKMQWNDDYVDVVGVVKDCIKPFKISVESKGLEFLFECEEDEINTVIDADRLAQVVYNLLSNSLKFTEKGFIKVILNRLKTVDGEVFRLSVCDSGSGMDEGQIDKIFQPFEQIQGSANMGKGTGLGLYITRCVVDRYHGRVWVESVLGEGAVFNIEMPFRKPAGLVL